MKNGKHPCTNIQQIYETYTLKNNLFYIKMSQYLKAFRIVNTSKEIITSLKFDENWEKNKPTHTKLMKLVKCLMNENIK